MLYLVATHHHVAIYVGNVITSYQEGRHFRIKNLLKFSVPEVTAEKFTVSVPEHLGKEPFSV